MKNFVKMIQQAHAERFSVVESKLLTKKIPFALLSVAPIAQAVDLVKNLRDQGMNITNLLVNDTTPPQSTLSSTLFT